MGRSILKSCAVGALLLAGAAAAANAQTTAKPGGGSVCSTTYTTTANPAQRAVNNTGAAVLVFGSGNAATLYTWRGPKPYDKPPTALTGYDYQYQLFLTPTASGYDTTYSSLASGTTVDVRITSDSSGNWTLGMTPRTSGSVTATGKLHCGSKPFEAK